MELLSNLRGYTPVIQFYVLVFIAIASLLPQYESVGSFVLYLCGIPKENYVKHETCLKRVYTHSIFNKGSDVLANDKMCCASHLHV